MICGVLNLADYIPSDLRGDVSDILQKIIDENPNRTLYFPDGEYLLDKPILTPADPGKSVDLQLSNYAVIRPTAAFDSDEAMIRLGATHPANDIETVGSNYSLTGGILDGMGKAKGISIDGGRETAVKNVSIKNTTVGLHVKFGPNNGSSDADITNVNIVGNGTKDAVGVLVEGFDNTFTNLRIANVYQGVVIHSAGNILRNVHPLFTLNFDDFEGSCGFFDDRGTNWYNVCYSDNFCYGYRESNDIHSIYNSCYCMWYSPKGASHTAFKADGIFRSIVTDFKIGFKEGQTENVVLREGQPGGPGIFERVIAPLHLISDKTHESHLRGGMHNKIKDTF